MNFDSRILATLFRLALFLMAAGILTKATLFIAHEAFEAHQHGFVSYRAINRALMGKPKPQLQNKRHQ